MWIKYILMEEEKKGREEKKKGKEGKKRVQI